MSRQKVIDQVLKLLAVAESSTHEGEVAAARELAEKLMLKHELAVSELTDEEIIFENHILDTGKIGKIGHRTSMANICAKFNGVYMCVTQGYKDRWSGREQNARYRYFGRQQDIENAVYMYEILQAQAIKASRVKSKEQKNRIGRVFNQVENTSFYMGFNKGLQIKLAELKAVVTNSKNERGLVPVSAFDTLLDAAKLAYTAEHDVKDPRKSSRRVNFAAMDAGKEAGQRASITKGIKSEGNGTLRLA